MRGLLWILVAAIVGGGAAACAAAGWETGMILTTDYTTFGQVAAFQRHAPWSVTPDLRQVGTDPVGRWHDGLYYVVNRAGGSNLQVLDPAAGFQVVKQFSLGAGRNPQDIAFAPDGTAWVSCYDQAVLLKVDVAAGAVVGTVSTAAFADADGLPETGWMQAVGERLYVTCQRLDRANYYAPAGPGLLAVFDMAGEAWIDADPEHPGLDAVTLAGGNPSGQPELSADHARLRLGCVGWYGVADGGVEEIDLAQLRSLGYVVTESALGGDLLDFVTVSTTRAYAIVSDASFHTSVRAWNPAAGALIGTVRASSEYAYADIDWDGGDWLYLADRSLGASGLRVFAAATGVEQTGSAIATGLPPAWIVPPRDPQLTAVASLPPPAATVVAACFPNPANPGCTIRLRGGPGTSATLTIHDLRGRRLRTATVPLGADGSGSFEFDGRDDRGRPIASGSYAVTAATGASLASGRLQVVR